MKQPPLGGGRIGAPPPALPNICNSCRQMMLDHCPYMCPSPFPAWFALSSACPHVPGDANWTRSRHFVLLLLGLRDCLMFAQGCSRFAFESVVGQFHASGLLLTCFMKYGVFTNADGNTILSYYSISSECGAVSLTKAG